MQAKSRLWFLLTFIVVFSSLFVSQSQTIGGLTFPESPTNFPVLTSINATSPTEYFN